MTTKICPACGCTALVQLISYNLKICGDCGARILWRLDPGQEPLFKKGAGHVPISRNRPTS